MALLTNSCWSDLPYLAPSRGKRALKHASTWCPSASLMTLARSAALQVRAPEPCLRRAPGVLSYVMEGGSPWVDAGPEGPASRGAEPNDVFFFLGVVSGSPLLPRSGSSSVAA